MKLVFVLVLALTCGAAEGQERLIGSFSGVGVRAMGMGGAYVGIADDYTATFWNPAGLAQLKNRAVYAAFLRNSFENAAFRQGFNRTQSDVSNTSFGSLGLVYPYPVYRGSLVLAAGFNRTNDFDSVIRIQGFSEIDSLQVDNTFSHEGELGTITLAGAIEVSPAVALGLTINLMSGEDENIREFTWEDTQDYYVERRWVARDVFLDDYDTSFSTTFGAHVRSSAKDPKVRFGATVTTGSTHNVSYSLKAVPDGGFNLIEYDDGSDPDTNLNVIEDDSYKISLPLQFGAGLAVQPQPGLLLSLGAHVAEWSQSDYKGRDEDDLRANATFDPQYEDVIRYHIGVEYQVPQVTLDLRAGFYTDPLPFVGPRNAELSVHPDTNPLVLIEQDRRYFTLGAGMLFDRVLQVDVAWTRGSFEQVEGIDSEEGRISRLFISSGYQF
jgi:long-chain fatty acid transport protein